MKIVTSSDYCVKCHSIGDFEVRGAKAALGPRLAAAQAEPDEPAPIG